MARLIEQRERPRRHHEQRHEVLEHRAAPRHERRRSVGHGERSAETEPVLHVGVALRDGDEARQPRLRREEIVERVVERSGPRVVPNREESSLRFVHEPEVHRRRHLSRAPRERIKPGDQRRGRGRRRRHRAERRGRISFRIELELRELVGGGLQALPRPERRRGRDESVALT